MVKLTVDGKSYTQPIVVKQDPRVKTPALAMQQVYALTSAAYYGAAEARIAAARLGAVRQQLAKIQAQGAVAQALAAFGQKAAALEGTPPPPAVPGGVEAGAGDRGRRPWWPAGRDRDRYPLGRERIARRGDERHAGRRCGAHREHAGGGHRGAAERRRASWRGGPRSRPWICPR